MPVRKTRVASLTARVRALGWGLCLAAVVTVPMAQAEPSAPVTALSAHAPTLADPRPGLDRSLQALKKDTLDLKVELSSLREDLLFPTSNQLAVFVSMDVGEFLALDSVQLRVDEVEVANYLYSAREAGALLKGGIQRLYVGNLKTGEHELVAVFKGTGPHHREYRRAASVRITKAIIPKYVELKITDRKVRAQPEFEIRDWE